MGSMLFGSANRIKAWTTPARTSVWGLLSRSWKTGATSVRVMPTSLLIALDTEIRVIDARLRTSASFRSSDTWPTAALRTDAVDSRRGTAIELLSHREAPGTSST